MAQDPLAPVGASANPNARGYATPIVFDLALPYKLGYEQKKLREKQAADARKASQDEFFKFNKEMYRDVDAPQAWRPIFNRQRDKYLAEYDAISTTPEGRNALQFVTTGSIIDARGNVRENLNDKERENVKRLTRIRSGIGNLVKLGAGARKYEDSIRQLELQGTNFLSDPFAQLLPELEAAEREGRDIDAEDSLSRLDRALRTFDVLEFNKKFAEQAKRRQSEEGTGGIYKRPDGLVEVTNTLETKNAERLAENYLQEIQGLIRTEAGRKRVQNARPEWFLPNGELNAEKVKDASDEALPGLKKRRTVSAFSPSAGGDPRSPKNLDTRIFTSANTGKNIAALYQPFVKLLPLRDDEAQSKNLVPIDDSLGQPGQIKVQPLGQSYVGRTRDGRYVPFPASHPNPRKYLEERGVVEMVPADFVLTLNVKDVGQLKAAKYQEYLGNLANAEVVQAGGGFKTQAEIVGQAEAATGIPASEFKRALQVASDTRQPGLPLNSSDLDPFFRLITRSDAPETATSSPTGGANGNRKKEWGSNVKAKGGNTTIPTTR